MNNTDHDKIYLHNMVHETVWRDEETDAGDTEYINAHIVYTIIEVINQAVSDFLLITDLVSGTKNDDDIQTMIQRIADDLMTATNMVNKES